MTTVLLVVAARAAAQAEAAKDADAPTFELDWNAPAQCPDGAHVRAEALRLAGAQADRSRHLKGQAVIRPDERAGWTLALTTELDGIAGERNLAGASCESLSEATALTLALILNPQAKVEPVPEPAAPPSTKASVPSPDVPRSKRTRPAAMWQLGALAGIEVGVLRDLAPWFGLTLGISHGRLSVRLVPGFTPPQKLSSDGRTDSGGRVWTLSAAALGCVAALEGRATLTPCLGASLVRLHGQGWGVLTASEASVYWTSAEFALVAGLPLGASVRLELWGFGLVPIYKSSVYLDDAGLVSRPASLGFGVAAGAAVALP